LQVQLEKKDKKTAAKKGKGSCILSAEENFRMGVAGRPIAAGTLV
jgi:hypothetical protein